MKRKNAFATLSLILVANFISLVSFAQEIPKPDFTRKPYLWDGSALKDFESVTPTIETKAKGFAGSGGYESFFVAPGISSPVKFVVGTTPKIVVLMDDATDPSEVFALLRVSEVKKDKRRFMGMKTGAGATIDGKVKITAKKINEKYFELVPEFPLIPGEYAIFSQGSVSSPSVKLFCFGT